MTRSDRRPCRPRDAAYRIRRSSREHLVAACDRQGYRTSATRLARLPVDWDSGKFQRVDRSSDGTDRTGPRRTRPARRRAERLRANPAFPEQRTARLPENAGRHSMPASARAIRGDRRGRYRLRILLRGHARTRRQRGTEQCQDQNAFENGSRDGRLSISGGPRDSGRRLYPSAAAGSNYSRVGLRRRLLKAHEGPVVLVAGLPAPSRPKTTRPAT